MNVYNLLIYIFIFCSEKNFFFIVKIYVYSYNIEGFPKNVTFSGDLLVE